MQHSAAMEEKTLLGRQPARKCVHPRWLGAWLTEPVQIFGGAGYMAEYPVERFYRDVRLFRIFEGTTQIQQLVIARELLKEASWKPNEARTGSLSN